MASIQLESAWETVQGTECLLSGSSFDKIEQKGFSSQSLATVSAVSLFKDLKVI